MDDVLFRSRLFEVLEFEPSPGVDQVGKFERVRRAPGVRVLLSDEKGDAFLLSSEFRSELGRSDIRLPGGKVFDSFATGPAFWSGSMRAKMAAAEEAARREVREELGVEVGPLSLLELTRCGATIEWDIYFFLSRGWSISPRGHDREAGEESIREVSLTKAELWAAAHDGTISEGRSGHVVCKYLYGLVEPGR